MLEVLKRLGSGDIRTTMVYAHVQPWRDRRSQSA
jgi:hypothetical protein